MVEVLDEAMSDHWPLKAEILLSLPNAKPITKTIWRRNFNKADYRAINNDLYHLGIHQLNLPLHLDVDVAMEHFMDAVNHVNMPLRKIISRPNSVPLYLIKDTREAIKERNRSRKTPLLFKEKNAPGRRCSSKEIA